MTGKSGMRVHVTHATCSTATTESMAMVSLLRMNGAASGVPVRRSGGREGVGEGRGWGLVRWLGSALEGRTILKVFRKI